MGTVRDEWHNKRFEPCARILTVSLRMTQVRNKLWLDRWNQNGTKERIEKTLNHCSYCSSENCLVKLNCPQNDCYVQHLQWVVSEKQQGR